MAEEPEVVPGATGCPRAQQAVSEHVQAETRAVWRGEFRVAPRKPARPAPHVAPPRLGTDATDDDRPRDFPAPTTKTGYKLAGVPCRRFDRYHTGAHGGHDGTTRWWSAQTAMSWRT